MVRIARGLHNTRTATFTSLEYFCTQHWTTGILHGQIRQCVLFQVGSESGIPSKWTTHFKGLGDLRLRVSSLGFLQRCSWGSHSYGKRHSFIGQPDPDVSRQRNVLIYKSREGLAKAYFKTYGSLNMRKTSGFETSALHYPLSQRKSHN